MIQSAQSAEVILRQLFDHSLIQLQYSPLLASSPRIQGLITEDRVSGMMLGLAIGDALGNTTESIVPTERLDRYGEIRSYLPNRHAGDRCVGLPSDDSQLAFWTLEHLLKHGRLQIEQLADCFCSRRIFGLGSTMREFLRNRKSGTDWYRCGIESAGNGALMRIAPILIPHLRAPSARLWSDTVLASMLTHNDFASTSSCVALIAILWDLLQATSAPTDEWWLDRFVEVAAPLEGRQVYEPRGGEYMNFRGTLSQFVDGPVRDAVKQKLPCIVACQRWFSGAYLLETVPSVLYILSQAAANPEEAIIRAVNDTRDNDTAAAIVGAAVGALHGKSALPANWINSLSGRTAADDDGQIFKLLILAQERFLHR